MRQLRKALFVLWILLCPAGVAWAEVHVSIGINIPIFPELVVVPGYPVYYAPRLPVNYFFYDGLYWVFEDDNWYASSWYNGPWWLVDPVDVPLFILRVPVRYYRDPPPYFRGWQPYAPPRWDRHWGHVWEQRRRGWNHWNRSAVPPRAPLPVYQRRYYGDRYPRFEEQRELRSRHYNYRPRSGVVREIYREDSRWKSGGPERRERGDRPNRDYRRDRDHQRPEAPEGRGNVWRGSEGRGQGGDARGEGRGGGRPEGRWEGHGGGGGEGRGQGHGGGGEGRGPGHGGGGGEGRGQGHGGGGGEGRGQGHGGGGGEGRGQGHGGGGEGRGQGQGGGGR